MYRRASLNLNRQVKPGRPVHLLDRCLTAKRIFLCKPLLRLFLHPDFACFVLFSLLHFFAQAYGKKMHRKLAGSLWTLAISSSVAVSGPSALASFHSSHCSCRRLAKERSKKHSVDVTVSLTFQGDLS